MAEMSEKESTRGENRKMERYYLLDGIRGFTLVNMVLYHAVYDLVFLFGMGIGWFTGPLGYVWQQYICWTFIFLAGMVWSLSGNNLKRGLLVLLLGCLLTVVTAVFMPSETIRYGILSFLGSAMLLFLLLDPLCRRVSPKAGILVSLLFFFLTRGVGKGYLGFEGIRLIRLPAVFYTSKALAFLGFPPADFTSSDYFPLIPWIFLFAAGYFALRLTRGKEGAERVLRTRVPLLETVGRHTLWIYMLHQPLVLLILMAGNRLGIVPPSM